MANQEPDWKSKFNSLTVDHESLEKISEETQQVFCRTLIRLTMSVKGLDSVLDPFILRIQETVKKDCGPNIRKKLDDLSDGMIRAADGKKSDGPFARLLARSSSSAADQKKLSKLWKQLAADPAGTPDKVIDELIVLLGGEVSSQEAGAQQKKTGLISRLFGGDKEVSSSSDDKPNSILKSVLDQLHWPKPIESQIKSLVEQLDSQASTDMWVTVITRVSEIIVDAVSTFQAEVQSAENFLTQLSGRLQELDGYINGAHDLRQASIESGRALNKSMSDGVEDISKSMSQSLDLDVLKSSVVSKLSVIQTHVSKHLIDDEKRHKEALEREEELREKLSALEEQSQALQSEMAEAKIKSIKDAVTGLPNRMAYDERLEQEYNRWKRFNEPLTLMVWDIDDFKRINDKYGHSVGDNALRAIAGKLSGAIRETDFIGRYGGEEFAVLLVGTDLEGAKLTAEKMRKQVEKTSLICNDENIKMTISCGISPFGEGDKPSVVFDRADKALYKAKKEGKNRWIVG